MLNVQKETEYGIQSVAFDAGKASHIRLVEEVLNNSLSGGEGIVREMCSHLLKSKGKRVRPLLVLNSGMAFSPLSDELVQAAAAAELIHMASLVHDDIIDNSPLRRKMPTLNKLWGNQFAVLCGDYLFAKAFEILARENLLASMSYMVKAIQQMCNGEILQAHGRLSPMINLDIYYERVIKKTAVLLESCCKSGASIGGADEDSIRHIGNFGLNIGISFQIIDDIMDFTGIEGEMGKPKGEDLRQGIITMPIILLMRDKKYESWVKQVISEKNISDKTINALTLAMADSGAFSEAYKIAEAHIQKAKNSLSALPQSEYTDFLGNMADMLQTRAN